MREGDKMPYQFHIEEGISTIGKKEEKVTIGHWQEACKGCGICVDVCPKDVWKMTKTLDKWNGELVTVDDANKCIKCMLCEIHCPDFAIKIL